MTPVRVVFYSCAALCADKLVDDGIRRDDDPSPEISLPPLGETGKNLSAKWTTELRSPRGIAAVAYAKNMPPACFLNAAGWHGGAVTDEGSPRAETSLYRYPILCGPSSASFGGTFPQRGKALDYRQSTARARRSAAQKQKMTQTGATRTKPAKRASLTFKFR